MKKGLLIWMIVFALSCIFWVPSCKHKSLDYYKETYQKNKQRFLYIQNKLQPLLIDNDSVFKYSFEVTGRFSIETSYINDSTVLSFSNIPIPKNVKFKIAKYMYKLDIDHEIVYKDSIKYVFSGRYKDVIVHYTFPQKKANGVKIDTNTYVVFDKS